jgi:hypothetical protein
MKTAEQFKDEIANHTLPDELYGVLCRIQLAAAKRALELAADKLDRAKVVQKYYPQDRIHNAACELVKQSILTLRDNLTVEQLNEK